MPRSRKQSITLPHAGPSQAQPQGAVPLLSVVAVLATVVLGFGDAVTYGTYGVAPILTVLFGAIAFLGVAWFGGTTLFVQANVARLVTCLALFMSLLAAAGFRGGLYASGPALLVSIVLVLIAAAAGLLLATLRNEHQALLLVTVLMAGASIAMVVSSPAPRIDVWEMYQAVARGLFHGHNPYTQHWSPHLPGQATIYAYFPGAAVLLAPFYWVLGDVRYGIIAALLLCAWLIGRMAPLRQAPLFGVLLLLFPRLTYSVEQSWSEPLVLLALLLLVAAVRRHKFVWAIATLAALLTFQQYDLLFLPLAAAWPAFGLKRALISVLFAAAFTLPWALAAPSDFLHGTVLYSLHYAFAAMSLSTFYPLSTVSTIAAYAVLGAAVSFALLAGITRLQKDGRFLLACSNVWIVFALTDRIARFNEWELAAGLVLAAGAESLRPLPLATNSGFDRRHR